MNNLTLYSALLQIQELNVPIRLTPRSVTLWSPNTRVPGVLRSIIREHAPEIRDMIQASRIEVCPSPLWHRQEWYYPGEDWTVDTATCGVCERLATIGSSVASRSNFDKIKVPAMRGRTA